MDHVWESNASLAPPATPVSPASGYPTETGTPTVPGQWWYHMLTEEIRNALILGGLTPSFSNLNQLGTAIQNMALAAANAEATARGIAVAPLTAAIAAINARTWATWQPTAATAPGGNIFGAMTAQQGDASSLVSGGSVVVPVAGAYSFKFEGSVTAGTMGFSLYVNGVLRRSTNNVNYTGQSHIAMEFQESLSASDSVQIWVSGAATVNFTGTQVFVARIR